MELLKIQEDKDFLIAQREKGRRGCMVGVDKVLTAKEERAKLRKEKETHRRQCWERSGQLTTTDSQDTEEEKDLHDECDNDTDDEDASVPGPSTSEQNQVVFKRARTNIITPQLAAALDRAQVTDRAAALILTEAANSLNCSPADININRSSIRRQRKLCRARFAASIKNDFSVDVPLVVHWDGKLLQDLTGKKHVDRLPILVSGYGVNKLLGVPKLVGGTGENTANAVSGALHEWGVADRVVAMCFDTTSSNTGHRTGACVLLEQNLGRDFLHLACRHHVMELILAAAFQAVMGSTSGPQVLLFKRFQAKWEYIDQSTFQNCMTDREVEAKVQSTRDDMLAFFRDQLDNEQPRGTSYS